MQLLLTLGITTLVVLAILIVDDVEGKKKKKDDDYNYDNYDDDADWTAPDDADDDYYDADSYGDLRDFIDDSDLLGGGQSDDGGESYDECGERLPCCSFGCIKIPSFATTFDRALAYCKKVGEDMELMPATNEKLIMHLAEALPADAENEKANASWTKGQFSIWMNLTKTDDKWNDGGLADWAPNQPNTAETEKLEQGALLRQIDKSEAGECAILKLDPDVGEVMWYSAKCDGKVARFFVCIEKAKEEEQAVLEADDSKKGKKDKKKNKGKKNKDKKKDKKKKDKKKKKKEDNYDYDY